jgi:hypothetical protein
MFAQRAPTTVPPPELSVAYVAALEDELCDSELHCRAAEAAAATAQHVADLSKALTLATERACEAESLLAKRHLDVFKLERELSNVTADRDAAHALAAGEGYGGVAAARGSSRLSPACDDADAAKREAFKGDALHTWICADVEARRSKAITQELAKDLCQCTAVLEGGGCGDE